MAEPGGRDQDAPASPAQAGADGSPGLGTVSWIAPLTWLEQVLPPSPILAALHRSLPLAEGSSWTPEMRVPAGFLRRVERKDSPLMQDPHASTPVSCQELKTPREQASSIASTSTALAEVPSSSAAVSPDVGEAPALQQEKGTGCVSPVGRNHPSLWDSPLSLLEDGKGVSLEGKESWRETNGASSTPLSPASAQARTALGSLPEARPYAAAVLQRDQGTSITPISVASAATWTSQVSQMEAAVNTSPAEKASTTDSTAETDSLLWHCSSDQLGSLSRAELEGRLQSTLIIMEALSRQIRASQEVRQHTARVGPGDQRDAATQTPVAMVQEEEQLHRDLHPMLWQRCRESWQRLSQRLESASKGVRAWSSDSRQLQAMVEASFLQLQEDRQSLGRQQEQMVGLLSRCQSRLQQWGRQQGKLARGLEEALKAKDAASLVLDSVQSCAAAQARELQQNCDSQRSLLSLLQEAEKWKAELSSGRGQYLEAGDRLAAALQADWAQMLRDYEKWRGAVARCLSATRRMAEEAEAVRREGARHQEVCRQLEERTAEAGRAVGRVNELMETNTQLDQDLQAALQRATASEQEQERLQEERQALALQLAEQEAARREAQWEAARLAQEKERAEQDRDSAQGDLREALDCGEFLEQENQVVRRQLSETEEELKSSLATLRERSAQLEDLKDAHRTLRQEWDSLRAELTGTTAELRTTEAGLEALAQAVLDTGALRAQFLEVVDSLQTALPRKAACTPGRGTPHRPGPSLVDKVLQAVAQEEGASCSSRLATKTPGLWSDTTAFRQATPAAPLRPSEIRATLAAHTQDLRQVAEQLCLLSQQRQEELRELRVQSLQLEQQLESSQQEHQAEMDACSAAQARLNKALHLRIQNEKELQELLRQHEARQDQLTDQWREAAVLREEVAQLRLALQKSETAASTLWEELSGTQLPDVQEKVWLRQEVAKLKEQLLQKSAEHTEALTSHLLQVRSLEDRLHQAQQLLLQQERTRAELKEALSVLPAGVSSLTEVQHLLDLL